MFRFYTHLFLGLKFGIKNIAFTFCVLCIWGCASKVTNSQVKMTLDNHWPQEKRCLKNDPEVVHELGLYYFEKLRQSDIPPFKYLWEAIDDPNQVDGSALAFISCTPLSAKENFYVQGSTHCKYKCSFANTGESLEFILFVKPKEKSNSYNGGGYRNESYIWQIRYNSDV